MSRKRRSIFLVNNMIGPLLIGSEPSCKKIRKEEKFQDCKHDKQLEEDNFPQNTAQCHLAEPVPVEMIHSQEEIAPTWAHGIHLMHVNGGFGDVGGA